MLVTFLEPDLGQGGGFGIGGDLGLGLGVEYHSWFKELVRDGQEPKNYMKNPCDWISYCSTPIESRNKRVQSDNFKYAMLGRPIITMVILTEKA